MVIPALGNRPAWLTGPRPSLERSSKLQEPPRHKALRLASPHLYKTLLPWLLPTRSHLLNRPRKNSGLCIFWEGQDFSRAIKPFILVIPNRLLAGEESAFRSFSAVS